MKRTKHILNILFGLIIMVTVIGAQDMRRQEYRIGARDELRINVLDMEEIKNLQVRVSEEGFITLPLLGQVRVEGMTGSELESHLASMLLEREYMRDAQVTVYVVERRSKLVSVLGAVTTPKTYELLGRLTLLQVLSEAGGLTEDAGQEIIIIRSLPDGSNSSVKIPVDDLMSGSAGLNIPLEAGDIINVPVEKTILIYVMGEVNDPGAKEFKKSQVPTLVKAIAMAGGFTNRAKKTAVIIQWTDENGKEQQKKVNFKNILKNRAKDIPLKDGDKVIVPQSLF